jgi:hypothetical protein
VDDTVLTLLVEREYRQSPSRVPAVLESTSLYTSHVSWAPSAIGGDVMSVLQARCILDKRAEAKTRREGTHAHRNTFGIR